MNEQPLLSKLRRAVEDYQMISSDDVIAVGLSGGKDSVSLLRLLADYSRFSPEPFTLKAITVDLAFHGVQGDFSALQALCDNLKIEYRVERTEIGEIVFDVRKEENPCSLCSKMRKGALYSAAKEMGCNKVALGHHRDDVIDTFLLSLLYEGRLSTFSPVTRLSRVGLTMIRPMLYIPEGDLKSFAESLPVKKSRCPADKATKREEIKKQIKNLETLVPETRERIFSALTHPERYRLFDRKSGDEPTE